MEQVGYKPLCLVQYLWTIWVNQMGWIKISKRIVKHAQWPIPVTHDLEPFFLHFFIFISATFIFFSFAWGYSKFFLLKSLSLWHSFRDLLWFWPNRKKTNQKLFLWVFLSKNYHFLLFLRFLSQLVLGFLKFLLGVFKDFLEGLFRFFWEFPLGF